MTYTGDERRRTVLLDAETKEMISEMHILMTDKDVGLCARVKRLDLDMNGNGRPGLKTQVGLLWGFFTSILGFIGYWIKTTIPNH